MPSKTLFPQPFVSSGSSMVGIMATSSNRAYAIPKSAAPEPLPLRQATAHPYLCRRCSNTQRQVWLSLFGFSWCAQGEPLFETSECLCWLWGLILNALLSFLSSCWCFSFALGHGISLFGGIQHFPVDSCSGASCNFGVLAGEDEFTSFYSAIPNQSD